MTRTIKLYAALLVVLMLYVSHALGATPTLLCTSAKTGDPANLCTAGLTWGVPVGGTDMVKTIVASQQVWEPYSTLTANSPVQNGAVGGWSTLPLLGIALFSSLPPVPPVPPAPTMQSVTITSTDEPVMSVRLTGLPIPACFTINATKVCVPPL